MRFDFALAWIALTAFAACTLRPVGAAFVEEPSLMTIGAVRGLSAEGVASHPRIRVRGVVIHVEAGGRVHLQGRGDRR